MDRVMIFGGSGSGKSTLARALGQATGLPVVHMDHIYWQEGWVQRPADEVQRLALAAAEGPRWIIEGNHSRSMERRAERADLLIWLDPPRWLRVWRVLRRVAVYRGRTRPDMAPGCPERFDWPFLRDWVIPYDRNAPDSPRARALAFLARWQGQRPVIVLRHAGQVDAFLKAVRARGLGAATPGFAHHPLPR